MSIQVVLFDHDGTLVNSEPVHLELWNTVLKTYGVQLTEHCVAIEDTEHGLRAAALAGIECLAIPTEMTRNHDFSLATAVLPNMNAAFEYIQKRYLGRAHEV